MVEGVEAGGGQHPHLGVDRGKASTNIGGTRQQEDGPYPGWMFALYPVPHLAHAAAEHLADPDGGGHQLPSPHYHRTHGAAEALGGGWEVTTGKMHELNLIIDLIKVFPMVQKKCFYHVLQFDQEVLI